jgi:hypothetical protein
LFLVTPLLLTVFMDIFVINLQVNHNRSITPTHTVNNKVLRITVSIVSAEVEICIQCNYCVLSYIFPCIYLPDKAI